MYEYNVDDVYRFADFKGAITRKKGNELIFKYCPYCDGGGKDKETMSINLTTGAFNCFRTSCGKQGHFVELARDFGFQLEFNEPKQYKVLAQPKTIKVRSQAVEFLNNRGISKETAERYKITTHKNHNNVIVFPFYDENNILVALKYRKIDFDKNKDKCKEWCEKDTKPILFGMAQCTDFERLVITEGQLDSLSVAECGIKNAVSVPHGARGFTWLQNCWEWITKFKEVVVFGDCEKGKITLIDTLIKRLPQTQIVKCVQPADYLLEKDANDILRKYGKEAIRKAVADAKVPDVEYVKQLADVKSVNIMQLPKIKTNIPKLDRVIGGMYEGQVILLSGKRGEGKSTFASQLMAEALEQNKNIFVYSGELPAFHFKNWLDLQIAGSEHIERTVNEYNEEEYYISNETSEIINKWYRNRAYIFDNSALQDEEYEGLLKIIEKAICRYNIKLVLIDNLMTALDDNENTELFRKQSAFVKSVARMAKTYEVVVILIAHPKKSNDKFNNDTVSGSSDITNAVDVVINYERNKTEGEDADSQITVTKNRLTGRLLGDENAIKLKYSIATKRIVQNNAYGDKKREYSCFRKTQQEIIAEVEEGLPL